MRMAKEIDTTATAPSDTPAAASLSGEATTAPASEATTPASVEEQPRARGQRGPDKRPRAKRSRPSASSSAPRSRPPKPPSPFDGPVAGEADGEADKPPRGRVGDPKKKKGAQSAVNVADMLGMNAAELAATAVGVLNAVIVQTATIRYGARAVELSLTPDEATIVTSLTEKYLDTVMLQMTPGEALGWTVALLFGSKIAQLEFTRGRPPQEQPPRPPPASGVTIDIQATA